MWKDKPPFVSSTFSAKYYLPNILLVKEEENSIFWFPGTLSETVLFTCSHSQTLKYVIIFLLSFLFLKGDGKFTF